MCRYWFYGAHVERSSTKINYLVGYALSVA
jgi:hypothetical protein